MCIKKLCCGVLLHLWVFVYCSATVTVIMLGMGQSGVVIDNKLYSRIREEIARRLGLERENMKIALEKAKEMWIK